jgi:hypothetical protein
MEKIENELYEDLMQLIGDSHTVLQGPDLLRRIYEVIYINRDLARVVFGKFGDKEFMKKISNVYRDRALDDWKKVLGTTDEATLDYLYTFITYTNIGVVERWILTDFQETPEQLARLTNRLLSYGASAFLSKQSRS